MYDDRTCPDWPSQLTMTYEVMLVQLNVNGVLNMKNSSGVNHNQITTHNLGLGIVAWGCVVLLAGKKRAEFLFNVGSVGLAGFSLRQVRIIHHGCPSEVCIWGDYPGQRERSPDYQKLYARGIHIWDTRRLQPNRSAMGGPRPGRTAFVITVNSCAR